MQLQTVIFECNYQASKEEALAIDVAESEVCQERSISGLRALPRMRLRCWW